MNRLSQVSARNAVVNQIQLSKNAWLSGASTAASSAMAMSAAGAKSAASREGVGRCSLFPSAFRNDVPAAALPI
ncbi:MAG: hypothetical protein H0U53_05005 [Actinobacteria bacterium]|nr:hypothetical protein [Actinomycetota bacterium]